MSAGSRSSPGTRRTPPESRACAATPADLYAMKTNDPALYASIQRGIALKEAGDVSPV
ncbi:MAG: hypothetical protein ABFC38_02730 [Methanospirillum sp.]